MARSPVFAAVRRAMQLARAANRAAAPPVDELVELAALARGRRNFLKSSVAAGLWLAGCGPARLRRVGGAAPRIVIVGAGLAGLCAAYRLKQAGVRCEIYEAAKRFGGRVFTAHDVVGAGLSTELGAEFIDSNHSDMLALCAELGLPLLDTQANDEKHLIYNAYAFDGRILSEEEVVEAFRPLAARIDAEAAPDYVSFRSPAGAVSLDRTTLADYLGHSLGVSGWLYELLRIAYVAEFGLDIEEQSALNFLLTISTDTSQGRLDMYGESDERYKIAGGNQRVVDALAERLQSDLHPEHRLQALVETAGGYRLTFAGPGSAAVEVDAEAVILAIPFSTLREVELRVELPTVKRLAIQSLGYGTNAKLFLGFRERRWRALGFGGDCFSDQPFQVIWDHTRMQPGTTGGLTLYPGGRAGVALGEGTAAQQAERALPALDRVFAGASALYNGRAERFHWPSQPLSRGSYACYRPGQWTTIAGAEAIPVGNLYFAGEHCSYDFQGYMNGAAESAKHVAHAILERVV